MTTTLQVFIRASVGYEAGLYVEHVACVWIAMFLQGVMIWTCNLRICCSGNAGICGILGSTYTGEYEDIEKLDKLVEKLNKEKVCRTIHI